MRPRHLVLCLFLLLPAVVAMAAEPLNFEDPGKQARFEDLLAEVRCLVCQNQSLADSNADLAQDLRREIYDRIDRGETDAAILDFLVSRYGDFVLFRPPLQENTWLLWFGPFLLLAVALTAVFLLLRGRQRSPETPLDEQERQRVARLLNSGKGE